MEIVNHLRYIHLNLYCPRLKYPKSRRAHAHSTLIWDHKIYINVTQNEPFWRRWFFFCAGSFKCFKNLMNSKNWYILQAEFLEISTISMVLKLRQYTSLSTTPPPFKKIERLCWPGTMRRRMCWPSINNLN